MLKTGMMLGGLLAAGAYFTGAIGSHRYERVVARPPAEVARALADLDIGDQPGVPGTNPARSGGVKPAIAFSRTDRGVVWTVMSGDRVATRMFADLKPLDGGVRTKVTTRVERGDAPDDLVSPAFRSEGLTGGLLAMALEDALNDLTRPPQASAARCAEMVEAWRLQGERDAEARWQAGDERPQGLRAAMGETARNVVKIAAMEQKLRAAGCDTRSDRPFKPVESRMRMH